MMPKILELSPEIITLQVEVSTLEKELGKVILERDELFNTVKPNLEAEYQKKIGYKELERMETEITARRYKRQIELIQAAVNRQESIEEDEIEKKLDNEFKEWYKKIEEQYRKVKEAEDRLKCLMSDEDNAEFNKLYRKLVFKLHPDLNPNQSKDEENLWHRVQLAYEGGDLDEMRSLSIIIDAQHETIELPSAMDVLQKRKEKLTDQIQKTINNMSELEQKFPFNIVSKLADKDWINTKVEQIHEQVNQWQEKCAHYEDLIKMLLVSKKAGVN